MCVNVLCCYWLGLLFAQWRLKSLVCFQCECVHILYRFLMSMWLKSQNKARGNLNNNNNKKKCGTYVCVVRASKKPSDNTLRLEKSTIWSSFRIQQTDRNEPSKIWHGVRTTELVRRCGLDGFYTTESVDFTSSLKHTGRCKAAKGSIQDQINDWKHLYQYSMFIAGEEEVNQWTVY